MAQWNNLDNIASLFHYIKGRKSILVFVSTIVPVDWHMITCLELAQLLKSLEVIYTGLYSVGGTNKCLRKLRQVGNKHWN